MLSVSKNWEQNVKNIAENGAGTLSGITSIIYFLASIMQFVCIYAYITEKWFDIFILSFVTSFVIASVPIIGSILGFIGATEIMHWSTLFSAILFFGWYLVILLLVFLDRGR